MFIFEEYIVTNMLTYFILLLKRNSSAVVTIDSFGGDGKADGIVGIHQAKGCLSLQLCLKSIV